jgi:hypothetical protein
MLAVIPSASPAMISPVIAPMGGMFMEAPCNTINGSPGPGTSYYICIPFTLTRWPVACASARTLLVSSKEARAMWCVTWIRAAMIGSAQVLARPEHRSPFRREARSAE